MSTGHGTNITSGVVTGASDNAAAYSPLLTPAASAMRALRDIKRGPS